MKMLPEETEMQALIKSRYGELVKKNLAELCPGCATFKHGACNYGLLPVTTEGKDCPYYQKGEANAL